MDALRQVCEVVSDTVTVPVPEAFRYQKVEVIILPLEESGGTDRTDRSSNGWPPGFLEQFAGSLPNFPDIEPEGPFEEREMHRAGCSCHS